MRTASLAVVAISSFAAGAIFVCLCTWMGF